MATPMLGCGFSDDLVANAPMVQLLLVDLFRTDFELTSGDSPFTER
jgi:hypothetical protein